MEKRRLGKTNHMSSVLAFGGAAVGHGDRGEAEEAIELAVGKGVNHVDIAPTYGNSEELIGPWMAKNRSKVFLGCKTQERTKDGARNSLHRSLELLKTDHFDLFQFHGVSDMEELNTVLGPGGALEAVIEAREQKLVTYIGITGHSPAVQVEALNRFPFDTVLFPLNRVLASINNDYSSFNRLLEVTKEKDVGTLAIKAIARQPWGEQEHRYRTWYEPFDTQEEIDRSIWYTLSQGVTTMPMASDTRLWEMIFSAVERYHPLDAEEQAAAMSAAGSYPSIFPMR